MPRKILIVVFAAVGVLADLREAPASGAPRYGNFNLWKSFGCFAEIKETGEKQQSIKAYPWAFYADLSYYADPGYFLRCYQRIPQIEVAVAWRATSWGLS